MRSHALTLAAAALLAACASQPTEPLGPLAKETVYAVTAGNQLIQFNAGQPQKTLASRALTGLAAGDTLVGIDYRVAKGQLFGLGASGQLYRIDTKTAAASAIGTPVGLPAGATEWGFDFNPTVDRIRVVSNTGFNMRLHPETGAVVDADPNTPGLQMDGRLSFDAADVNASKAANVVAAGYTYNKDNDKLTTNYALDGQLGVLVHQGSKEGVQPMVSPNSGKLYTVGSLGVGSFDKATLDISDVSNAAYSAITTGGQSVWYRIDLATGKATRIAAVAGGPVVGAAIEP